MAHTLREVYSPLVEAKLRKDLVLKDGIVFNNDYEGNPIAGAVKIPVRDTEVTISNYDKANGLAPTTGSTTYDTLPIVDDVAINELIDDYDSAAVPDNIVADRVESGAYVVQSALDNGGATTLLAGSTIVNETTLDKDNIYSKIVDLRTAMSKANVPNDGKRYLLVTPDTMALVLNAPLFVSASSLGDAVKDSGVVGRIAGFNVIEWNDTTANLAMIAGHPRYATRVKAWKVDVRLQDLAGSGKYIGASAVQGRLVFGHKVLKALAVRSVYTPGSIAIALAKGATTGTTISTITGNAGTLKYKVNPTERATYDLATATYGGTALTSGTTEIPVSEGDIIEVVDIVSAKVAKVGYITVTAAAIK